MRITARFIFLLLILLTLYLPLLHAEEESDIEEILILDDSDDENTIEIIDEDEHEVEIETGEESDDDQTDVIPDPGEIKETDGTHIIDRFIQNGKGKTKITYSWFFNDLKAEVNADPPPDAQSHFFDYSTGYSTFIQQDFFRLDLSTFLTIGNGKYTYSSGFEDIHEWELEDWLRDSKKRRRYLDINECYVSLFFPFCDIIVGKKIFSNTMSTLYSPADIYKVIDTHDPFDPRESGKTEVQVNFYPGDFTLSLLIWPYYQGGKEFSLLSRWGYYRAIHEISEGTMPPAVLTIEGNEYPPITIENMSYLGKIKGTVGGWDFFATAFHGLAGNTVSRVIATIPVLLKVPEVVPVFQGTGGFSTTIGRFEIHGEVLYNYTYKVRDDHYIRSTGGLRYTFDDLGGIMDRIEFTGEYAREDILEEQDNPDYEDSTEALRLFKNDILVLINFGFTPHLHLNMYAQYGLTDSAFLVSPGLEYRIVDNLSIVLGAQFFIAPEESDFYWWRDNNRLIIQVSHDY